MYMYIKYKFLTTNYMYAEHYYIKGYYTKGIMIIIGITNMLLICWLQLTILQVWSVAGDWLNIILAAAAIQRCSCQPWSLEHNLQNIPWTKG